MLNIRKFTKLRLSARGFGAELMKMAGERMRLEIGCFDLLV